MKPTRPPMHAAHPQAARRALAHAAITALAALTAPAALRAAPAPPPPQHAAPAPPQADRASSPASDWPPQLHSLLELYRRGQFADVQRECANRLRAGPDPALRPDVQALYAMALLRMPERADRLAGRSILAGLEADDPAVARRGECLLAVGLGSLELGETAAALDNLDRAADAFAAAGQSDRAGLALAALADAWARHTEWELTPGRFAVVLPAGSRRATPARAAQIEAVRTRAAALDVPAPHRRRIDLTLARVLLGDAAAAAAPAADATAEAVASAPADRERAVALLESLAASDPPDETAAHALERLARLRAAQDRLAEALALYRRVADAGLGDISARAAHAADEIAGPRLEIDVPRLARPGREPPIVLRARNLERLHLELRRVDLVAWLEQRQGRLVESQLPDDGALASPRCEFQTPAAAPHAWWTGSPGPDADWSSLAPGAYVIIARAAAPGQAPIAVRRLLIVSEIRAAAFLGEGHAVVWALGPDDQPLGPDASAQFWMHGGTFVAERHAFDQGVARFPLPPEAARTRDRRFACVVTRGQELAVCTGSLPELAGSTADRPQILLTSDGLRPRDGNTLRLKGVLLPPRGVLPAALAGQALRVELLDGAGNLQFASPTVVNEFGTFEMHVPITRQLITRTFHVVVRDERGVLPTVARTPSIIAQDATRPAARLELDPDRLVDPRSGVVRGRVRAFHPGGAPLAGPLLHLTVDGLQFDGPQDGQAARRLHPYEIVDELALDGERRFEIPLRDMQLDARRAVLDFRAATESWERIPLAARRLAFVWPEPVHLRVEHRPRSPATPDPLRFFVRCFDPAHSAAGAAPTLHVRADDGRSAPVPLHASDDEFISEPWHAPRPGRYEARVELVLRDAPPVIVDHPFTVGPEAPAADDVDGPARLRCAARLVQRGSRRRVEIELFDRVPGALLALVEDGAPLAAHCWPAAATPARATLDVDALRPHAARVRLVALDDDGVRLVGAADVDAGAAPGLDAAAGLALRAPSARVSPGSDVPVRVSLPPPAAPPTAAPPPAAPPPAAVDLTLRLLDLDAAGPDGVQRALHDGDEPIETALTIVASCGDAPDPRAPRGAPPLTGRFARALLEGHAVWLSSARLDAGELALSLPLPDEPGRYRLVAAARSADGALTSAHLDFDTGAALRCFVDAPPLLSVGDRAALSVTLHNPGPAPVPAALRIEPGAGLAAAPAPESPITVAPGQTWHWSAGFEAASPASDAWCVQLDSPDGLITRRIRYEIRPADAPAEGVATGWFTGRTTLRAPPGAATWANSSATELRVQRSLTDVVLDAACDWLNDPVESTAWSAARLTWAAALLRLRPDWHDRPLHDLLADAAAGNVARRRLDETHGLTLGAFRLFAAQALLAARNADGGWGNWAHDASRAEPTAWASEALADAAIADPAPAPSLRPPNAPADRPAPATAPAPPPDETALDALLAARRGPAWGDHAETARSLRALAGYGAANPAPEAAGALRIRAADAPEPGVERTLPLADAHAGRVASIPAAAALELSHDGPGRVSVVWTGAGADGPPPLARVRRSVVLLEPRRSGHHVEWLRTPLPAGTDSVTVPVGQFLLIQESWTLDADIERAEWVQRVPPGAAPRQGRGSSAGSAGQLHDRTADVLIFTAPALPAGAYTREYVLVAVRPASAVLPDPELRVRGLRAVVQVEPPALRLNVTR